MFGLEFSTKERKIAWKKNDLALEFWNMLSLTEGT